MNDEQSDAEFLEDWTAREVDLDGDALQLLPELYSPGRVPRHNLPAVLTRFVGREDAISAIVGLIQEGSDASNGPSRRLVTLLGTGGAGKTRLALEVAIRVADRFPDGVWLVEIASLNDPSLVPRQVAAVLEIREVPDQSPEDTLIEALRERRLLILLDNCEHLLSACSQMVRRLLAHCPGVQILTTTREALNVDGEVVWTVPALSLPHDAADLQRIGQSESVQLFVDRARFRLPDFDLTPENAASVAQICRGLEGIPLAIELAAARIADLSPEDMAARLDDSLQLLVGRRRGSLPHQQTLRAAIEWSYRLLEDEERSVFDRLSMFSGGWQEAEACAVVGFDLQGTHEILTRLVEKTLVVVETAVEEAIRYRLLDPVRQYAREQLQAREEEAATQVRHAAAYLALAQVAEVELLGPHQGDWLDRLDAELGNIRVALTWCLVDVRERTRAEMGLRLASALWRFWHSRGYMGEGRRWLERGLTVPDIAPQTRAEALHRAGWHALIQSDYPRSRALLEESAALFQQLGDDDGLASVLDALGDLYTYEGDHERGREAHERGLELYRRLRNRWGISMGLNSMSLFSLHAGDRAGTERLLHEALALVRELGDVRGIAITTHNLGMTALNWEDYEAASGPLRESLALFAQQGNKLDSCYCLEAVARVAGARGQVARAARLFAAAAAIRHDLDAHLSPNRLEWRGRAIAASRGGENEQTWERAWAEGSHMTLAEAVAYALEPEDEDEAGERDPSADSAFQ